MFMKQVVYLFTAAFPYGRAESFLENEIPVLAKKFNSIFIFPHTNKGEEIRTIPANCIVQEAINERHDLNSSKIYSSHFFFICSVLIAELVHCPSPFYFLKNIRQFNSILIRGIYDAEKIRKSIKHSPGEVIFYSYWMNDWALALAILKHKKVINNFVFRCAGFDIYDERHKGGFLPFRYFVYKNASAVYPNSMDGVNYIKSKKCFPEKIKIQYWGTGDNGLNKFDENERFTIVSCSNVIPLKRVHLIIEMLKNIHFDLYWVHFGDGNCMEEIKEKALLLPTNITFAFKGRVPNKEVIEFYKSHSVNLFITTSETESLPVSVQEAISFGIPVIATNVGGMAEIVNEQTGYLIDKIVDIAKTAKLISDFKMSNKNTVEFRKGVRDFWQSHFEAEHIYSNFYKDLINI